MPTTIPLLLPPKNRTHESVKQEYRNKAIDDSFSLLITKVEQKKKMDLSPRTTTSLFLEPFK
jgi:hypothetical protein